MKRDLELIRRILLYAEKENGKIPFYSMLPVFGVDADILDAHLRLMQEMDLIRYGGSTIALTPETKKYDGCFLYRITAKGYDYLDAVRDETAWGKIKGKITSSGGELTLAAIKALISNLIGFPFRH